MYNACKHLWHWCDHSFLGNFNSFGLCEQLQPTRHKNWVSHFSGRITKKPFSIQVSCFVMTPRPQIAIKLRPNLCPAETLNQVSLPVFQNWALNWPDFRHQVSQHTPATQKNTKNKNQCLKALRHSSPPSRWSNDQKLDNDMAEGWTWRSTLRRHRGGPSWHSPPPPRWSNEPSLARSVTAEGTWAPPNTTPLLLSAPAIKIMSVSVQACDMLHKKNWCTHFKIMSLSVICCCCTRRTVALGIRLLGL